MVNVGIVRENVLKQMKNILNKESILKQMKSILNKENILKQMKNIRTSYRQSRKNLLTLRDQMR